MKTPIAAPIGLGIGQELESMHLQIAGIASGGGGAGPEWDDLVVAYELNGDDTACLLDAGPNELHLVDDGSLHHPVSVAGVIDEARYSSTERASGQIKYSLVGTSALHVGPTFTAMCWVKTPVAGGPNANAGYFNIINSGGGATQLYVAYKDFGNKWQFKLGASVFAPTTPVSGPWIHVAVTYAASSANIYFDGVLGPTYAITVPFNVASTLQLFAGSYHGNSTLDMFRYFNRELTADDITAHFNVGAGLAFP